MTYTLTLRKDVELDIEEQFEYYEEVREGLGHDFLLYVEDALDKIQKNPLNYRQLYKELRRVAVRRFPYRIFPGTKSKNYCNGCISCTKKANVVEFTNITNHCTRTEVRPSNLHSLRSLYANLFHSVRSGE